MSHNAADVIFNTTIGTQTCLSEVTQESHDESDSRVLAHITTHAQKQLYTLKHKQKTQCWSDAHLQEYNIMQ